MLPDIIAGNIIGIVAQRLMRKLCPHCKQPYQPEMMEGRLLGLEKEALNITIYQATGCEHCNYQGYKGRIAIMELLKMDSDLDELIAKRAPAIEIRNMAFSKGFITLAQEGIRRVLDGSTSLDEVARIVDLTDKVRSFTRNRTNQ